MVVLEGGGGVVTIGNNQYLQPDYLSPLQTTLDSKKSPLALLAQTCSQIGADSTAVKPILASDKNKKPNDTTSKSPSLKTPKSTTPSSTEVRLAYKPYEANVLSHHPATNTQSLNTHKILTSEDYMQRPNSKSSVATPPATTVSIDCNSNSSNDTDRKSKSPNSTLNNNTINSMLNNSNNSINNSNTGDNIKSNSTPDLNSSNANSNQSSDNSNTALNGKQTPNNSRKAVSPAGSSQRGASPIIRSGMEVLHGHPKDMQLPSSYKPGSATGPYGMNPLAALCCPPGMEQHASNPAFRPPFAGSYAHQHAAMLAAAAAQGYPGASGAAHNNPYISYQRIKTPSGGETIVPVCKDPYCPGCPYSAHTQQMLMGAPCPSGCTQCEHQKYGLAMAATLGSLPPGHPYAAAAAAAAAAQAQQQAQMRSPYVCNWITGDSYCGKRYNTSDELFSHLRNAHTGNLSDPAAAAAALAQSQAQSLLSSLFPPRGYPTAPLSPLSAARYHPYGKPTSIPPPIPGSAFSTGGFNPAAAAALGPYYSPYAMYGQRIGSAAAHQ
ncbi:zinc finger protein Noc [Condylostylus longicornis]|uniref:zinc finger protein Noc n=1 Tax=Condylostylus longicornis TaxID=2530218 RepID=UPI00244DD710|nr:zinc finger protein Noc [Condylostylus longicornis]